MRVRPEILLLAWLAGGIAQPAQAGPWGPERPHPELQQRWQEWHALPPERREQILHEQQRFQRLPPAERERLWEEYRRRDRG